MTKRVRLKTIIADNLRRERTRLGLSQKKSAGTDTGAE